jgi:thiol:disulfide interchange protein
MKALPLAAAILLLLSATPFRAAERDIYPAPEQAKTDLAQALGSAKREHKRILIDFGGNWCTDCHVLDIYMHDQRNKPILDANFLLVHVNIGHKDANLDLARKYQIPLDKGVPAIAVLSETGKLLYSQKGGEFEAMRRMESASVTQFLAQWRPQRAGCSVTAVTC